MRIDTQVFNQSYNKAESLDKWANSKDNYYKFIQNEPVEDFQLFDYYSFGSSIDERIQGYKQEINIFSQDYINQYDIDGDNKLNIDEFIDIQSQAYNEMFGEELDLKIGAIAENLQQQFSTLSTVDQDPDTVSSLEFAAFLGIVDAQDGQNDGIITYQNYNTVPMLNGYEEALKAYYNDFANN